MATAIEGYALRNGCWNCRHNARDWDYLLCVLDRPSHFTPPFTYDNVSDEQFDWDDVRKVEAVGFCPKHVVRE